MNYEPDFRFVDSHSEGIRCNNYPGLSYCPRSLFLITKFNCQSGMVEIGADPIGCHKISNLFASFSASDIYYSATLSFLNGTNQISTFIFYFPYQIRNVFPVKTGFENIFFSESQLIHNIIDDLRGS